MAGPQTRWGSVVLDRLPLTGDERVLDAGCGSGRVTSLLIEQLPKGRVVAVDGSPSMVEKVRDVLRSQDEAQVSDLIELKLEDQVDAIFSSAVFHWVLDHDALFSALHDVLRPGGKFAAQCGGAGNIDRLREITRDVQGKEPYAAHFDGFEEPWNYAGAEVTEERLARAGFAEGRAWLQPWRIVPPSAAEFLATVCLGPHVDRLPESLREPFIADVLAAEPEPLALDYVRLNIEARVPA